MPACGAQRAVARFRSSRPRQGPALESLFWPRRPWPRAEAAHMSLAAASAADAPAQFIAAGVLLAALARRALADRMICHGGPPADEDHNGNEHQHARAGHRDRPALEDVVSPSMPAPG